LAIPNLDYLRGQNPQRYEAGGLPVEQPPEIELATIDHLTFDVVVRRTIRTLSPSAFL
jgi:hypothetical protein